MSPPFLEVTPRCSSGPADWVRCSELLAVYRDSKQSKARNLPYVDTARNAFETNSAPRRRPLTTFLDEHRLRGRRGLRRSADERDRRTQRAKRLVRRRDGADPS